MALAQGVTSANTVGYTIRVASGTTIFAPGFQKVGVGSGTTVINDLLDETTLTPYADELLVYDAVNGVLNQWLWDGTGWTDWTESKDMEIGTGEAIFANFSLDQVIAGEVVNADTLTYAHNIPAGASLFGSAFPVPLLASNFNFGTVLTAYADSVLLYDPVNGVLNQWLWDGTGFTDWTDYLPNQIAAAGEGVMIENNSSFSGLVETVAPAPQN